MAKKNKKNNKKWRETKVAASLHNVASDDNGAPNSVRGAFPANVAASTHSTVLPQSFPSGLQLPKDSFLRNEAPYEKSFQAALDTAYLGFAVDLPCNDEATFAHDEIQTALRTIERVGLFRTDVTQPFGLGTKCAKTYVTRCLVGAEGTTYKYLGLRMFSHPWNNNVKGDDAVNEKKKKNEKSGQDQDAASLEMAVKTIRQLNEKLTERTVHHLQQLNTPTKGRAGFDIVLINRMEYSPSLKQEPSMGEGKCSVSWHADSCLEQYSTIAVYHTIEEKKPSTSKDKWEVALRVAHNSEGPNASHRGTDIESSVITETPPIAVSLPSGAAYYLLDDFNHHHQHAVLTSGADAGVRFSCTHRLLREGHNVNFMLQRCKRTCGGFHKKGAKVWRSEQLLLTELESEWIRQFYIQGQQHKDLLWKHWCVSIQDLLKYWSLLESRTKATIDVLQAAAQGRCAIDNGQRPLSKAERKQRQKQKKAIETVEELVSRSGQEGNDNSSREAALIGLYEGLSTLLEERAEMRRLWIKREHDHVFRELDPSQRPMPVPFRFSVHENAKLASCDYGISPLPGSPDELFALADQLRAFGRGSLPGNVGDLPHSASGLVDAQAAIPDKNESAVTVPVSCDTHHEGMYSMPLEWKGWKRHYFGLEMQSPWAGLLLERKKKIEIRAYDLPPALLRKRIEILQSKETGTVSALGNSVSLTGSDEAPVTRVGWCRFAKVIKYEDKEAFEADEAAHMVKKDSSFGWKEGKTKVMYGWIVGEVGMYGNCSAKPSEQKLNAIVRRHRSLFELVFDESSAKPRKKRKRY